MTEDKVIDLRSDTLTHPTEQMRRAMQAAEVGDDCHSEDPTVNRLEAIAAERLSMESALYLPSGTMANSTALITHLQLTNGKPNDETPGLVVHEVHAHMFSADRDRIAKALFPIKSASILTEWGVITPTQLQATLSFHPNSHPRLLCLENTHNYTGGGALTPRQMSNVATTAHSAGMHVHCDGARLFNAAIAQQLPVSDLVRDIDSVMFCVSKGLSAPVGSILCGNSEFIEAARNTRKIHGGSMRQAGVIAAAGIVAIEEMTERLSEDHLKAAKLSENLASIDDIELLIPPIPTNFAVLDVHRLGWTTEEILERYRSVGILATPRPPPRVRLVLNRHIDELQIDRVVEATRQIVATATAQQ